jgi:hypothetical protein
MTEDTLNHTEQYPRKILVIANQTCPCEMLVDEVAARVSTAQDEVLIIAPALNSRLRHWVSDIDGALARAHERVESAVAGMRVRGITARGQVGDANPLSAIEDALATFAATEIVIATYPPGQSNWLERRLIENATLRFDQPITHLVSTYGLIEQPIAA